MGTTQSGYSTRREDQWIYESNKKMIKQSRRFYSFFSESEKKELTQILRKYDFLKMIKLLNDSLLKKLLIAVKQKKLKDVLDEEIKTNPDLEIFKFFLSKFEYQYQYSIIEIVKQTSAQGFLLDLDKEKIETMRSWKKLRIV